MYGWTATRLTRPESISMSTKRKVSRVRTKDGMSRFGNAKKTVRGNYLWIWECRSNHHWQRRLGSVWRSWLHVSSQIRANRSTAITSPFGSDTEEGAWKNRAGYSRNERFRRLGRIMLC